MHICVVQLSACEVTWHIFWSRKGGTGGGEWVHSKVQTTWLLLGLAVESPWSALGGPFLSSFAQTGLDNGLLAMYM